MNAVDSSVVVAACAAWHADHEAARRELDRKPRLVAHCGLEAYSVLTRLPAPHRIGPALVADLLDSWFTDPPLSLDAQALRGLVRSLRQRGLVGGAVYDGLVAMSAAAHDATLLTLDRRAEATYRVCGVSYRFIAVGETSNP